MSAEKFFKEQWGTGFIKATLSEQKGLLELSMSDIYETMEAYKKTKPKEALIELTEMGNCAKGETQKVKFVNKLTLGQNLFEAIERVCGMTPLQGLIRCIFFE